MAEKLGPEKRHAFVHNGQKVFEWDQTLEEVNMYIELPKGVPTKLFHCTIQATHVEEDPICAPLFAAWPDTPSED